MPNICISSYTIIGAPEALDTLESLMRDFERNRKVGNWVGHIAQHLGVDTDKYYVRGWWENLHREAPDTLCFDQESAWEPIYEAWDAICEKLGDARAYFIGEEEGCEVFLKRDHPERNLYPYSWYIDACVEGEYIHEYFPDLDSALRFAGRITETNILNIEMLEAQSEAMNEENEEQYIHLHEYTEV